MRQLARLMLAELSGWFPVAFEEFAEEVKT
jgi:thymidylate synthase ThyX